MLLIKSSILNPVRSTGGGDLIAHHTFHKFSVLKWNSCHITLGKSNAEAGIKLCLGQISLEPISFKEWKNFHSDSHWLPEKHAMGNMIALFLEWGAYLTFIVTNYAPWMASHLEISVAQQADGGGVLCKLSIHNATQPSYANLLTTLAYCSLTLLTIEEHHLAKSVISAPHASNAGYQGQVEVGTIHTIGS